MVLTFLLGLIYLHDPQPETGHGRHARHDVEILMKFQYVQTGFGKGLIVLTAIALVGSQGASRGSEMCRRLYVSARSHTLLS